MKKLYIFGNHKMNFGKVELNNYLKQLAKNTKKSINRVGIAVSTPYLYLAEKILKKTNILYGAQNCHYEKRGSFTGENSVKMLKDFGCKICIVGHSERMLNDNETDTKINLKLKALLKDLISPIFCFGETKEEKDKGLTKKVIKEKLEICLKDLTRDEIKRMYFSYEPVWAIGTGETAPAKEVEAMAKFIKSHIGKMFDITNGEIKLLYGGSLTTETATEIFSKTDIDGGLIGGASLDIVKFLSMANTKIED